MNIRRFLCALAFVVLARQGSANTALYNDGTWVVTGIDATDITARTMNVAVDGVPAGEFAELEIQRAYAGGYALVCSIQANGGTRLTVPPTGVLGGAFYLTRYVDCYQEQQLPLGILTLNIHSNTKKFKSLQFNGTLSNATTLQSTDLAMKLELRNNGNVRMDVRYALDAIANVCVDQWSQQSGEGFQVVSMTSNYISNNVLYNDGFKMKGFLGPYCDCCDCYYEKGSICANFVNQTDYILPYFAWMSNSKLQMLHWLIGPRNTPALRVTLKNPKGAACSVQGNTVLSADPTAENVNLWVNWSKAKTQYNPGDRVLSCHFNFEAMLPDGTSCDLVVP
jgi:hypothetical protein